MNEDLFMRLGEAVEHLMYCSYCAEDGISEDCHCEEGREVFKTLTEFRAYREQKLKNDRLNQK